MLSLSSHAPCRACLTSPQIWISRWNPAQDWSPIMSSEELHLPLGESSERSVLFRQCAQILHHGDSPCQGHYTCLLAHDAGQYWWMSDAAIPQALSQSDLRADAQLFRCTYIIMYVRVGHWCCVRVLGVRRGGCVLCLRVVLAMSFFLPQETLAWVDWSYAQVEARNHDLLSVCSVLLHACES